MKGKKEEEINWVSWVKLCFWVWCVLTGIIDGGNLNSGKTFHFKISLSCLCYPVLHLQFAKDVFKNLSTFSVLICFRHIFIWVLSLKVVHILLFYYSTLLKNPFDTDRWVQLKDVGRAANHQSDRQGLWINLLLPCYWKCTSKTKLTLSDNWNQNWIILVEWAMGIIICKTLAQLLFHIRLDLLKLLYGPLKDGARNPRACLKIPANGSL